MGYFELSLDNLEIVSVSLDFYQQQACLKKNSQLCQKWCGALILVFTVNISRQDYTEHL